MNDQLSPDHQRMTKQLTTIVGSLLQFECLGLKDQMDHACQMTVDDPGGYLYLTMALGYVCTEPVRILMAQVDPDASVTFGIYHGQYLVEVDQAEPEAVAYGRALASLSNGDMRTAEAVLKAFYQSHPELRMSMLRHLITAAHRTQHEVADDGEPA